MTTTKIFIKDYAPLLIKKKFVKIDEYFRNKENVVEFISPEGFFILDDKKIYKLKPVDKEIVVHSFEGRELLFDASYFEKEMVLSQIPYDHVRVDVSKLYYGQESVGKKSFLKLVVEGLYESDNNSTQFLDTKTGAGKYVNFTPTNFYFLATENFDNILIKKELNVFLSLLM
jgi:hypothetical protein